MYGIIATWRMALEGISEAADMLKNQLMLVILSKQQFVLSKILSFIKALGMGDCLMKKWKLNWMRLSWMEIHWM